MDHYYRQDQAPLERYSFRTADYKDLSLSLGFSLPVLTHINFSYWDFSFPTPESMESQKQDKWPASDRNKEKLAGMGRKEKLGNLFQTYRKHFPKNLFPKIAAFYTFQATCSPLTINSFPLFILFDFH